MCFYFLDAITTEFYQKFISYYKSCNIFSNYCSSVNCVR